MFWLLTLRPADLQRIGRARYYWRHALGDYRVRCAFYAESAALRGRLRAPAR